LIKFLITFFPINLALIHFSIFEIFGGFNFTVAHLYQLVFLFIFLISFKKIYLSITYVLISIIVPLFTLITPFNYNITDFFKSYFLLLHSYMFLSFVTYNIFKKPISSIEEISKMFSSVFFIIAVFTIIQSITINLFQTNFLWYPFGDHSYLHTRSIDPTSRGFIGFGLFDIIRSHGLYLEPSILGIILSLGLIFEIFIIKKKSSLRILLLLIAQFLAFSKAAIFFLLLVFLFSVLFNHKNLKMKWILIILTIPILIIYPSFTLDSVLNINSYDTSGWRRLIFPILVISKEFNLGFMGHPFGSVEYYIKQSFDDFAYNTIDTGMYLIIFYFGILGIIFFMLLLFYSIKLLTKNFINGILLFSFVYCLFVSNAWTPETATYVTTLVLFYKIYEFYKQQTSYIAL